MLIAIKTIKLDREKITEHLQPVNVKSKHFTNYKNIVSSSKNLEIGMKNGKPLYLPFGAGVYGFYFNGDKFKEKDIPKSIDDLWLPKWKGRISLNKTQIWYNIGISFMALGMPPFHMNDLLSNGRRKEALSISSDGGILHTKLKAL